MKLGRIVVRISGSLDEVKCHVRHEAQDGLWDAQSIWYGGRGLEGDVEHALQRLPDQIRRVLQTTRDRGAL